MNARRLVPVILLALAGCAPDRAAYPSLGRRAVEARGWNEPATIASQPVQADPALDVRIAEQVRAPAAAKASFGADSVKAARLADAARDDMAGGERWIAAQTALADLDAERAATVDADTVLGDLALTRATAGQPDYPSLDVASDAADAQLAEQTRRIGELQAMLPHG